MNALADAQIRQLRLLEIGIDPDFRERADRHQTLTDLNIIAGIDIAAGHHAVDLAVNVAIAQVQLGLIEIGLGLHHLGFRLFDAGGVRDQFFEYLVDVAALVSFTKLFEHLVRSVIRAKQCETELGH